MKISNIDNNVHILDSLTNTWSVLRDISNSTDLQDPFYVFNIGEIFNKFQTWKAIFPKIEPFYAVKCNDNETLLKILSSLGAGFNCTSKNEINRALSIGINSERLIFNGPTKMSNHIKYAAKSNLSYITFDNSSELDKIKNFSPNSNLILTVRCDEEDEENPLNMKFGCDLINEAPELLKMARSLNLNVVGLSFYFGNVCQDKELFSRSIKSARDLFDYAYSLGFDFNILDLGNGLPSDYSIEEIAAEINHSLNVSFDDISVRIIAEPSRFLVNSAFTLACNIQSIRSVEKMNHIGDFHTHHMYYINDGVFESFNSILYDQQCFEAIPLNEYPLSKMYSSSVWGPTCEEVDQVIEEITLPKMEIGDWIIFENMGAYAFPLFDTFDGFPQPKLHFVGIESTMNSIRDMLPTEKNQLIENIKDSININSTVKFHSLPKDSIFNIIPFDNDSFFSYEQFK